ncbi:HEAT repeat domain-containing protein [Kitasatospora sp. NPDC057692]|uniref:HEAT repeat domain-containing protein n=1 Tax=Kitasatospora sp. NPDC057692 TaxID=3346215 RepID=UPI0036AC54B1
MTDYEYQSDRYVLRPGVGAEQADDVARGLGWELVREIARDKQEGVDGQLIWLGPDDVSLHYVVDALSGIGYTVLAGPGRTAVEPFVGPVLDHLRPWTLPELFERLDEADEPRERVRNILRIGLAAAAAFDEEVFRRISGTYADSEPRVRLAGLWAATYTGYPQFLPRIREIASHDPDESLRSRAASIATAFASEGDAS